MQPLVVKEDSSGANRNYGLYIAPNSLQVRYSTWAADCATKFAASSNGQLMLNSWNYVVFTYDGSTEKLYLNGVLDSSEAASPGPCVKLRLPVKMGMETSAFAPFAGNLDNVQIYTQALSAAEVSSLYVPLVGYWKLDEPSVATSFADSSSNEDDGACGGARPTQGVPGKVGRPPASTGPIARSLFRTLPLCA